MYGSYTCLPWMGGHCLHVTHKNIKLLKGVVTTAKNEIMVNKLVTNKHTFLASQISFHLFLLLHDPTPWEQSLALLLSLTSCLLAHMICINTFLEADQYSCKNWIMAVESPMSFSTSSTLVSFMEKYMLLKLVFQDRHSDLWFLRMVPIALVMLSLWNQGEGFKPKCVTMMMMMMVWLMMCSYCSNRFYVFIINFFSSITWAQKIAKL